MKPYFNDDFSKMIIERSLSGMTGKTSYGICPICGQDPCQCVNLVEETVELEEVKKDGKDDNGFDSCWKGYKKQGTKIKGGKEVNNCVKAGYEPEGEEDLSEVAPPGAKSERMVKHIKKSYAKDGKLTDKEKSIAYATAWKAKNKSMKEEKEEKGASKKAETKFHTKLDKLVHKTFGKSPDEKKMKEDVEHIEEKRDMPGNQEKIDANKNGKIDAHDFAILRNKKSKKTVKEMWQIAAEAKAQIEVMPEIDDKDPENIKKKDKKEKEDK
jgi:hypothetical protein